MTFNNNELIEQKLTEFLDTLDKDSQHIMRARLKRNFHLVTGAILTDNNGRICLVEETKAPHAGKWNLPLGHLESGETVMAGAKREVKEETGYDVELTALLPFQNVATENVFRILYVGKVTSGTPAERLKTDTSDVNWFTIPEIQQKLNAGELRDVGVWHDVTLFQTGLQLPLNLIQEADYKELEL